jgi:hypothetical protein
MPTEEKMIIDERYKYLRMMNQRYWRPKTQSTMIAGYRVVPGF